MRGSARHHAHTRARPRKAQHDTHGDPRPAKTQNEKILLGGGELEPGVPAAAVLGPEPSSAVLALAERPAGAPPPEARADPGRDGLRDERAPRSTSADLSSLHEHLEVFAAVERVDHRVGHDVPRVVGARPARGVAAVNARGVQSGARRHARHAPLGVHERFD